MPTWDKPFVTVRSSKRENYWPDFGSLHGGDLSILTFSAEGKATIHTLNYTRVTSSLSMTIGDGSISE